MQLSLGVVLCPGCPAVPCQPKVQALSYFPTASCPLEVTLNTFRKCLFPPSLLRLLRAGDSRVMP